MAIADPKTYATREPADAKPTAMSLEDLVSALRSAVGNDDDSLKKRAAYEAEAHARLNHRENTEHPGISVYSFPEGDVQRPKAELKCAMFWVGYPLTKETLTPGEIDLLNRVEEPGDFLFHRTDGSAEKLTIDGQKDAKGAWQRITFHFPCQGQNKHNVPSLTALLREVLGLATAEDDLRAELARLRSQLAQATAS